jgi:hypothetical protein
MLSVIMLSVIMLSVIMLSVVMLSAVMLSVVRLDFFMLSVVAPFQCFFQQNSLLISNPISRLVYFYDYGIFKIGATTLGTMTLWIMTFKINDLIVTVSITNSQHNDTQDMI